MKARDILPNLLATLTGPRYQVRAGRDFEWSDRLWIHNIFRVWELLAGARCGIFVSVVSNSETGKQIAFTLEAQLALFEGAIRQWLKRNFAFKIVMVPQLQLVGMHARYGFMPYRFAIAVDSTTGGNDNNTAVLTYSHTSTGSNLGMVTSAGSGASPPFYPTSVTYNLVAETQRAAVGGNPSGRNTSSALYSLASPATGAHNVILTYLSNNGMVSNTTTFTGVDTTSMTGATNTDVQFNSTLSISLTTTQANSYIIDGFNIYDKNVTITVTGQQTTALGNQVSTDDNRGVSYGLQATTATSYTFSYNLTGGSFPSWAECIMEVKAMAASGPTNVKTWDGITQSTGIKTYLGVTLGNTKTIDGVA